MKENESAFAKSLSGILRNAGFDVVRLESHSTGNGIPDMFVQGRGIDLWIELKNDKVQGIPAQCDYKSASPLRVDWRPGQIPWAYEYFIRHNKHKNTLTIVSLVDGYAVVPMIKIFDRDHYVDWSDVYVCKSISPETLIRLTRHFSYYSSSRNVYKDITFRQMINGIVEPWDIDYDPEVLFNEFCPDFYRHIYNIDDKLNSVIWKIICQDILEYFELA